MNHLSNPDIEVLSTPVDVSMNPDWFAFAQEDHFWMKWRYLTIRKFLRNTGLRNMKFLDIGCGHAILQKQFEQDDIVIDGCDVDQATLCNAKKGKGRIMLYDIFDRKAEMLRSYDGIFLLDVLEHVEDDRGFVKVASEHVKTGGLFIINVPAHMFLFSKFDTSAGHLRRYNAKQLISVLRDSNIEIVTWGYWGWSLIPVVLVRKIYLKFVFRDVIQKGFKPSNKIVDGILYLLMKLDHLVYKNSWAGNSIIAVGKVNR